MSKKSKKVLKIVGIVVAVWLIISAVNVLAYKRVLTSSKSHAQMANPDEESPQMENGFGGGGFGGGGSGSTNSSWYWAGPLCWINTDICW